MTTKDAKVMFNGDNYHEWEVATMFHLKSKGLAKSVTKARPTLDVDLAEKWDEIDEQACGKIGERVDPRFYEQLRGVKTAKDMMDTIKNISEASSINTEVRTRRLFMKTKLQEGEDMYAHLGKMEQYRRILSATGQLGEKEMVIQVMEVISRKERRSNNRIRQERGNGESGGRSGIQSD